MNDAGATLRVTVVYEDVRSREHAVEVCTRVTRRLGREYEFDLAWFKASHLHDEGIRRLASGSAAAADMVVFCLHTAGELPAHLAVWLEEWIGRRASGPGALVLLCQETVPKFMHVGLARFQLEAFAHRARMDFICEPGDLAATGSSGDTESLQSRAGRMTPLLDEILHHRIPPPRWGGINE